MRAAVPLIVISLALALGCAACSKHDAAKTSSDLKAAAADIKRDPAIKGVASDLKKAAAETKAEVKKGAAETKKQLKTAGADLKQGARKAGHDLKKDAKG